MADIHANAGPGAQTEDFEFTGHRIEFSGQDRPWLACDPYGNKLYALGGSVARIRVKHGDTLGATPLAEYVVDPKTVPTSNKHGHYVHQLGPWVLPTLRWDDSVEGYAFDGGGYIVADWIEG